MKSIVCYLLGWGGWLKGKLPRGNDHKYNPANKNAEITQINAINPSLSLDRLILIRDDHPEMSPSIDIAMLQTVDEAEKSEPKGK